MGTFVSLAVIIPTAIVIAKCSGKSNGENKEKKIDMPEDNKKNIKNDLEDENKKDVLENKNKKVVIDDERSKLNSKEAIKKNILKRISQGWEDWYYKSKDQNKSAFAVVVGNYRISNVISKISEKVADYKNSGLLDKITDIYDQDKRTDYSESSLNNGKDLYSDKLQKLADIFSGESEPNEIKVDFRLENENKYWTLDFKHQDGKESRAC